MGILKRIALIAHWVGFISAILFGLLFIGFALWPSPSNTFSIADGGIETHQRVLGLLLSMLAFFSCSGLGWMVRFILMGKVHFLPWRTLNH